VARFYGVLLIVLLVTLSGVIAYVGDIVGRRMGRKRLSLFGMRPRHTAIAISVVAGMLITLFTLAAAMAVSRNVQDGFLRVDEMRRKEAELSGRIKELTALAEELERSRVAAQEQVREATDLLRVTRDELEGQKKLLAEAKRNLARTVAEARVQERGAQLALVRAEARLTEQVRAVEALETGIARFSREIAIGRANPILFHVDQPLAVRLLAGGQSVAALRTALEGFVSELDRRVRAAGAAPLAEGEAAVTIRHLVMDEKSKSVAVATGGQVLAAIAQEVHRASGGVIVRAYSVYNTVEGEPVYIDFDLFANQRVYSDGQVLAQTIIDGRLSEAGIYAALVSLLKDDVGAKARKDGVMPRVSLSGSEGSGGPSGAVGEMSYDDLFASMERLRSINGPAKVTALAADDTWTIGPLKVELRIEPAA